MEYLIFLQGLREAAPSWVTSAILFVSELMGETEGLLILALIYWCICKKLGQRIFINYSGAYMLNTILKNIMCIERPFVKDSRITPYKQATGYSFPSGHTMLGTSVYSTIGLHLKKYLPAVVICGILTFITAFGRNWLGVHTIQDVVVGVILSLAFVYFNCRLLDHLDRHPEKDIILPAVTIIVSVLLLLLVPGTGKVVGIALGSVIGWFVERRFIKFENGSSFLAKAVAFIGGALVLLVFTKMVFPFLFGSIEGDLGKLLTNFGTFFLIMGVWPAAIKLINIKIK